MSLEGAQRPMLLFTDNIEYQWRNDYHIERKLDRKTSFDRLDRVAHLPVLAHADLDFSPNIHTPSKCLAVIRKVFPTHSSILIMALSGQDSKKHQCQEKESVAVDFIDKSGDIIPNKSRMNRPNENSWQSITTI
jgi:hypothetical protein